MKMNKSCSLLIATACEMCVNVGSFLLSVMLNLTQAQYIGIRTFAHKMVAHRAIAHETFGHRMTAHTCRAIAHKPFAHRMFAHKTIAHRTLAHCESMV